MLADEELEGMLLEKELDVRTLFIGKQDDTAGFIEQKRHGRNAALANQGHVGFDVQIEKQTLQPVAAALQRKRHARLFVGRIIVRTDSFIQFFEQEAALQILPFGGENFWVNQIRV